MADLRKIPSINNISSKDPLFVYNKWKDIQGDKIKNQGIANTLFITPVGLLLPRLKDFGCAKNEENKKKPLVDGFFSASLGDDMINCINKLEDEGKSRLLYDKLYLVKDKNYWLNLPYVLKRSEKIGLGLGSLFLVYLIYKLVKR